MKEMKRALDDNDKKLKKDKIIEQALQIFNELSYQKIKIEDIAKNSNVAKGTIFLYFKTKESLFLEITIREFETLFKIFEDVLKKEFKPNENYLPDDFINFLKLSFSRYTNYKILFRLISITNVILEQNSDYNTTSLFKKMLYDNLIKTGANIEELFIFIKKGMGISILLDIYAIIIGFQNITDSSVISKEVIEKENLTLFKFNFEEMFFSAVKLLILGLNNSK